MQEISPALRRVSAVVRVMILRIGVPFVFEVVGGFVEVSYSVEEVMDVFIEECGCT